MFSITLKEIASKRAEFTQKIRNFFNESDFLEVETPILTPIPGMEPHLTPFETLLKTPHGQMSLYFNHSPELQMKKLLSTEHGFSKIFNLTKVFRNGEIGGPLHNPEFTMLEWYRLNADYTNIMTDCESLIKYLVKSPTLNYQNHTIDLSTPWERITTQELFQKYCDIDLLENRDFETLKNTAIQKGYDVNGCLDWDDIFFKIFLNHIEKNLGFKKPTFVYDYPITQAALAKKSNKEPFFAERFELYIAGIELANAFSELTDADEQRQRLNEEQALRRKLGKTVFDIDEEFLAALESITEPAAGIALGLDRLFMILMNKKSIEEVILFPLSKMINEKTWQQLQA